MDNFELEGLGPNESIDVQIYDSYTVDNDPIGTNEIHLWSLNRDSENVLLRIQNFPIFCHVQLPLYNQSGPLYWTRNMVDQVVSQLTRILEGDNHAPVKYLMVNKTPIYYHQEKKNHPMILLIFETVEAMNHCSRIVNRGVRVGHLGKLNMEMHETRITPIRKMFTLRNCEYSECIRVPGREVPFNHELRISIETTKEYIIEWKKMEPLKGDDSFYTYPLIMSFDWEVNSENILAFPNSLLVSDEAYMGSFIVQRLGDPSSRRKFVILKGDCDDFKGVEIIRVEKELDAIFEMCNLIKRVNPDVLIGYNIDTFDVPYLDDRVCIRMKEWPKCSRLLKRETKINRKSWNSSAYGDVEFCTFDLPGRISIDVLSVIKRDYKLRTYRLADVSKYFLGSTKRGIPIKETFRIFQQQRDAVTEEEIEKAKREMNKVVDYCIQDSDLVIDLFEKVNIWYGLVQLSNIVGVTITQIFTRGQQIRCMSQLYNLASKKGVVINKRAKVILHMCGGLVGNQKPGIYDNAVCLDFTSLYPTIMIAHNICYTTLIPTHLMDSVPDEMCNVIEFDQVEPLNSPSQNDENNPAEMDLDDDEEEEGEEKKQNTHVVHYKFKFLKREVKKGLVPELLENLLSERRKVKKLMKGANKTVKELKKISHRVNTEGERFLYEGDYTEGCAKYIKPALEQKLNITETLKNAIEEGSRKAIIYNKRQLALKISANSLYGFTAAQHKGMLPLIEAGICITALGRRYVTKLGDYIKKKGGMIVYGDTDSVMATIGEDDPTKINKAGEELAEEISGHGEKVLPDGTIIPARPGIFPPPMGVEMEKAMRILCIKSKFYAYYKIGQDGKFVEKDGQPELFTKGIVLARRDKCYFLQDIYRKLLHMVMQRKSFHNIFRTSVTGMTNLLLGKVDPHKLSIVKKLGSNYASDSYPMKIFADELRRIGRPIKPGDRPEYIIVLTEAEAKRQEKVLLGKKQRLLDMWLEIQNDVPNPPYPKEIIDYPYYIEKLFQNSLDVMISIGCKDFLEKCEKIGYTPVHTKMRFSSIQNPIKMIVKMIKDLMVKYKNLPPDRAFAIVAEHIKMYPDYLESLEV